MLLLPTDHLILFTSSPLIYLISKDEGRSGGSCQCKSTLPPKGRYAGHAFCFFPPGCELEQLPWLHPSCCWAGGGSKHPRAGGKRRKESGNAFHKQQDSWNGSSFEVFLRSCSRVMWIGKGWGNMQLPSAIPHVLCFCHRVPECVGGRWVCEWWCWVGACSRFTQETQIIKFCGNTVSRKYFSVCSLEKQGNTFSRKQFNFYDALLCESQRFQSIIKVNRDFNLLCIQSVIQFQFQPHHKIVQI